MTKQQLEYLRLFENGYTVTEIAKFKGKSASTISRVLKRARSIKCPFSSDCTLCPLEDCAIEMKYADMVNSDPCRNDHRTL